MFTPSFLTLASVVVSAFIFVLGSAGARLRLNANRVPMPVTAADVAGKNDGKSLVAYLLQRDASAAVCDLGTAGPHLATADVSDELVNGLRDRGIDPTLWRDCVDRLARSTDRESAASLLDAVVRSYVVTIRDLRVEYYPITQQQLTAMHALLLEEPSGITPHADATKDFVSDLRDGIEKQRFGPVATRFASEMIDVVEMEHGMRDGRLVDNVVLDSLYRSGNEVALKSAARRLPDAQLRTQAQRRVIRLHIQASPYAEVRQNAAAVEETMLRFGANPVAIDEHRPSRAWVDAGFYAGRGVRVRQDLQRHVNALLGSVADGSVSVLPQPSLRGALYVGVEGIDHPLTVCALPSELDPSPCVPASAVTLGSDLVRVDPDGSIRFAERLTGHEAAELAASARSVVAPLSVGGVRLAELAWNLEFETPRDLVLESRSRSSDGPAVQMRVDRMATGRLGYNIVADGETYDVVVESSHVSGFHVVSKGGNGSSGLDGSTGHDGAPGLPGSGAICPSFAGANGGRGDDGGSGGDGGAGGQGGRGGDIVVEVMHGDGSSAELVTLLRASILSEGGTGGTGGSAGAGGHGGSGGSGGIGATCFDSEGKATFLSGGSPGSSGSDGRSGFAGLRGGNGEGRTVTVRVIE